MPNFEQQNSSNILPYSFDQIKFCKATAYFISGDHEDILSQVCNFDEAMVVEQSVDAFVRGFKEPDHQCLTMYGKLMVWDLTTLRVFLMDFGLSRIVHFEIRKPITHRH